MVEPFLKWAGGKRWLVQRYSHLIPVGDFDRYIEPFVGSGAVFFHLAPNKAILNDRNNDLIETYSQIRTAPAALESALQRYHKNAFALKFLLRGAEAQRHVRHCCERRAFLYLNRVCFNGIYRVNRRGEFNVPMGSKNTVAYPSMYLEEVSRRLKGVQLKNGDFAEVLDEARRGDFVYIDPPYTVAHNNNGFIKYNQVLFSWDDQVRLANAAIAAAKRGAKVFVSNADHAALRKLYVGLPYHLPTL